MNRNAKLLLAGLTTLMMLTGCNSMRLAEERNALWKQNQELQQRLDDKSAELDQALAERAEMMRQMDAMRSAAPMADTTAFDQIAGVETISRPGAISVRVPGDVLFASGRVELKGSALQTLDEVAAVIAQEYPDNTIRVEGYTDTDPIKKSKWKDNLELSLQRAAAVVRHLDTKGVDAKRMYAAGFGEHRPRDTKAKSRRVEIVVILSE